mgnify:CR=1 FL=1|tara:strand:+ start:4152 stop:4370 length:219 start_codon:yes stop_codon:yes gene_type:complete
MTVEAILMMGCWITLGFIYLIANPTFTLLEDLLYKRNELKSEMIVIRIFYILLSSFILVYITKAITLYAVCS